MKYRPYSMSRLMEYERCPRRFFFKYEQGLPEMVEQTGRFGAVVHKAISQAIKGEDWESVLVDLPMEEIEEAKIKVRTALNWLPMLGTVRGTEVKFALTEENQLTDFEADNAFVRGIIDLITETPHGLAIWDWKTGHSKPTKFQIFFYARAVELALRRPVVKAGYILLTSGELLEYDVDEEELEITSKKMWKLIRRLEKDKDFEPIPGQHCAFCSYVSLCPLAKNIQARDIPAIRTKEEAVQVAREIIVLQDKLKRYKALLKEFVKIYGKPIEIENGLWKLEEIEYATLKRGMDKRALIMEIVKLCNEKGLDPSRFFDLKVSALRDIMPSEVEVRRRLNLKYKTGGEKHE